MEPVTAAITAGAALAGALIPQIFSRRKTSADAKAAEASAHKTEAEAEGIEIDSRLKLDEIGERLSAIEHQVKNTHRTNLRQDIDKSNRTMDNVLDTVRLQAEAYSRDRKETLAWRERLVDSIRTIEGEISDLRSEHQAAVRVIGLHTRQLARITNPCGPTEGVNDEDKSDLVA
ncbi:MAG: DUF2746 domain-containing protein [Mobiluncus sp.]|uniref:DUF2746 domain-containing protein n=1 Tax=Mobiluncus porci TaxID=2652278 RepID=A0A7K0K6C3_9ACTO|nr:MULTISPECIES: DUF2746 domain-containing protein [Mobiluncus]MCI6583449.1 DUF2746 domain-containing protein [Mobiluncus sp.]MST50565.1 DUF2746 domain-containing protein [Mobiluncus porci]